MIHGTIICEHDLLALLEIIPIIGYLSIRIHSWFHGNKKKSDEKILGES